MTISDDGKDRATAEAARWLIALEDDPDDPALRARFDAWVATSPDNAAAWADTAAIYDLMAETAPAHQSHWAPYAAARRGPLPAEGRSPPRRLSRMPARRRIAVAVAAAMAACLAAVVAPSVMLRFQADYVTATGEALSLTLEDGSTVRLGPESAIALDFDRDRRRVDLIEGAAFFEVARDAARPFRIATRSVTTTVLGTAFDVVLGRAGAAVAVRRGTVSVDDPAAAPPVAERLEAGHWVRVGWDGGVQRGVLPPDEVGAWMTGQIVARDRPLGDVVDVLRRYFAGAIVLADGALGMQRVSGVYNVDDPAAALRAMAGAHGAVVHEITPWLLVVSAG
jgi:transmembrane sensor